MNKVILIGFVGKPPETRTIQSGTTVCVFTVATTERCKGEEKTTWFKVAAFGKLGEICQKFIDKGRRVCVVGSVSVSTYDGNDGQKRFSLDVRAEDVEFLSPKEQSDAAEPPAKKPVPDGFTEVDDLDESLPF